MHYDQANSTNSKFDTPRKVILELLEWQCHIPDRSEAAGAILLRQEAASALYCRFATALAAMHSAVAMKVTFLRRRGTLGVTLTQSRLIFPLAHTLLRALKIVHCSCLACLIADVPREKIQ